MVCRGIFRLLKTRPPFSGPVRALRSHCHTLERYLPCPNVHAAGPADALPRASPMCNECPLTSAILPPPDESCEAATYRLFKYSNNAFFSSAVKLVP